MVSGCARRYCGPALRGGSTSGVPESHAQSVHENRNLAHLGRGGVEGVRQCVGSRCGKGGLEQECGKTRCPPSSSLPGSADLQARSSEALAHHRRHYRADDNTTEERFHQDSGFALQLPFSLHVRQPCRAQELDDCSPTQAHQHHILQRVCATSYSCGVDQP